MILSFLLWVLMGAATAYFANQRGRDPVIWFMVGMLLGVLGLLLLFVLPPVAGEDTTEMLLKEELPEKPQELAKPHDDYLIKDWYYLDASRAQQGPMDYHALKAAWDAGAIGAHSFVWCEGMSEWQRIEQLPELKEKLE